MFWQFRDYSMDVYYLFCLQNVEVGFLYVQYLILGNPSVEIGKLFYLFIFTGIFSAATKLQNEARAWPEKCHEQAGIK